MCVLLKNKALASYKEVVHVRNEAVLNEEKFESNLKKNSFALGGRNKCNLYLCRYY